MNSTIRNILAVVVGLFIGGTVNMGIILISGDVIPPPEGADVTTMEGLTAAMHLFEPKHFIIPFLAHALGTLAGAIVAALIAGTSKKIFAFVIGLFFLIGGIVNVFLLPSPLWFAVLDIVGAYIPMSYLAYKMVVRKK